MDLDLYQVDSFTDKTFGGNPAAVCPLESWLPDDLLQNIANENNLSETAFFVPDSKKHKIRWFTPQAEVNLCGHATLASAFIYFTFINKDAQRIDFESRSGLLSVLRVKDGFELMMPVWKYRDINPPELLVDALGHIPEETYLGEDVIAVYKTAEIVKNLSPNMLKLSRYEPGRGVIVTAPGDDGTDFVSRAFYPKLGIAEDPVTGSAHCLLTPYWAERLGKKELNGHQISPRGGKLHCRLEKDRICLTGQAALYMTGKIHLQA